MTARSPPPPRRRRAIDRRSHHGIRRTDIGEPRQRRTDHVPPDRGGDGRRAHRDRPRASAGRPRPGRAADHRSSRSASKIVAGTMRFRMRRKRVVAGPGEVVVVPPGVPHDFANVGDEPALVRVDIRPALKMEQLFETAVALAEQGRTMMNGIPKPLDLALFTREFEDEVQAAFPPFWVQRLALAPLARLRGAAATAPGTRPSRPPCPAGSGRAVSTERSPVEAGLLRRPSCTRWSFYEQTTGRGYERGTSAWARAGSASASPPTRPGRRLQHVGRSANGGLLVTLWSPAARGGPWRVGRRVHVGAVCREF